FPTLRGRWSHNQQPGGPAVRVQAACSHDSPAKCQGLWPLQSLVPAAQPTAATVRTHTLHLLTPKACKRPRPNKHVLRPLHYYLKCQQSSHLPSLGKFSVPNSPRWIGRYSVLPVHFGSSGSPLTSTAKTPCPELAQVSCLSFKTPFLLPKRLPNIL